MHHGRRRRPPPLALVALGVLVFLFPHSIDTLGTRDTQDRSWIWALYRSWRHQTFGRTIDFSYGPYGFLEYPSSGVSRGLWLVAVLAGLLAAGALAGLTFMLVRRSPSWSSATTLHRALVVVVGAGAVLAVTGLGFDLTLSTVGVLSLLASLAWDPQGRHSAGTLAAISSLAALGWQVKFSEVPFYVILLVCATVVEVFKRAGSERRRSALVWPAVALVSFVAATCVLWTAAGNSLNAFPAYLSRSYQFIVGYDGGLARQASAWYVAAGLAMALVLVVLLAWGSVTAWREDRSSRPRTLCVAVVIVSFAFLNWKEGFVRQDTPAAHQLYGLYALLFAIAAVALMSPLRPPRRSGLWAGASALVAVIVLVPGLAKPVVEARGVTNAWDLVDRALLPGRNAADVATSLRRLRATYLLPASMRATVGDQGVIILPWNLTLGPAYSLHEVDLPVPQVYTAYTPVLDRLDSSFLIRRHVPFVIFSFADMDGRYPLWSAPATYDTLFRDYDVVQRSSAYALLKWDPVPQRRTLLAAVSARVNSPVTVPACPDGTTTASLRLGPSVQGAIENFAYQVTPVEVSMTADAIREGPFRLVWTNAADGLMMSNYFSSTASLPRFGRRDIADPPISSFTVIDHTGDLSPRFDVAFYCHAGDAARRGAVRATSVGSGS